jgi:proteasome lid subunit RPN8/RPN11
MKIPLTIVEAIYKQAMEEKPLEACGYLAGEDDLVKRHFPMTNIDRSETHFAFDPEEQFQILKKSRTTGLELMAVYHSHPATPARPSAEDIRLAYDPNMSYVIVSLANGQKTIKSFKIKDGEVVPEPLKII